MTERFARLSVALAACAACFAGGASGVGGDADDLRPPFDKRDYRGTVAVQVNPWFPLDKPSADAYGQPARFWCG